VATTTGDRQSGWSARRERLHPACEGFTPEQAELGKCAPEDAEFRTDAASSALAAVRA